MGKREKEGGALSTFSRLLPLFPLPFALRLAATDFSRVDPRRSVIIGPIRVLFWPRKSHIQITYVRGAAGTGAVIVFARTLPRTPARRRLRSRAQRHSERLCEGAWRRILRRDLQRGVYLSDVACVDALKSAVVRSWTMKTKEEHSSVVGQRYFYGESGKRNYRKAFPYLLKAALAGDIHPQNLVGYCYGQGLGVQRDIGQAVFWFKRAAKHHHKEALFNLALMYVRGEGVKADSRKAFALYKRAALLGDAPAQCNLGICYLEGVGTKKNLAQGIAWIRAAARKGDDKAQFNLGRAYLDAEGVRRNRRLARIWLEKAAKQNHRKALRLLRQII